MQLIRAISVSTVIIVCFASINSLGAQNGGFELGSFKIGYDERGITALANPHDPFGAELLTAGQRLGLAVKYRTNDGPWQDVRSDQNEFVANSKTGVLKWINHPGGAQLKVTQEFVTDGNVLDWTIRMETTGTTPVEIGDFSINLPVNGPRGENPKQIFEHGFLKHQFISGNGSFLYFIRASGRGPFPVVTVHPGTKLEYFAGGAGGRGAAQVFVHSGVTGRNETRGTWRQAHTTLSLGPAGSKTSRVDYGFRIQWAESHEEIRDVLYREGLFDVRSVPGMTIPTDLTAGFDLHTRARIQSIEPEFPNQTKIVSAGQSKAGHHVYSVEFKKLGENRLTIHHDGNRKTYLEYFVAEPLETLIKKRSSFIANRQQIRDPTKWWDGVFGPYDMKNKVVRTIDDPDIFTGRMIYVLTCDDPGLCKAPYIAEKNVSFPDRKEIEAIEYYLEHFVWGKLQRTDRETPYPYGVYGTPNWYVDRDPERRRAYARTSANATATRDLSKEHVWRSYDYPHVLMLYYHMFEIGEKYPSLSKYLDAPGYLERAWQTAHAFFTYPYEIYPSYYETYKWGLYNELIVLKLADALDTHGFPDRANWLRSEWEKKVKYFVYDDPYPFRSEYAFDRTAFESSYAFAKYGATHEMKPDTNLWHDVKLNKWYSHPNVSTNDSMAFMERQLAAGLSVRGWLEPSYYQLGADGGVSYMAAMGGWGILDYAINFAKRPNDWLQLGYASYLSSWCLVNSGTPESNYGYWFPGKENDGAAGWQFMSSKTGRAWMGADVPRGPWNYDGEIDLGFGGALRMAATILTDDPVFGWTAYGGKLAIRANSFSIVPRDGLRQRFFAIASDQKHPGTLRRIKFELDRDGFASEKEIIASKNLDKFEFTLENRIGDSHSTGIWMSLPVDSNCIVRQDGEAIEVSSTSVGEYPSHAVLKMSAKPSRVVVWINRRR